MKVVALAVAPMVSAFAPLTSLNPLRSAAAGSHATTMMAEMSKSLPFLTAPPKLDGSMAGDVGFDPLGLSEIDDVGIDLYWMREAELKHARVAMLATIGVFFCDQASPKSYVGSWPGFPAGKCQADLFWQVLAERPQLIGTTLVLIGTFELFSGFTTTKGRREGNREPGDFGLNPYKFAGKKMQEMKEGEIKNGRLAMLAAAGQIMQGVVTHQSVTDNLNAFWS
ncbi:unnamed protein product [Chrysoparadoxa australica]